MKHQTSISGDVPFYKIGTFGGVPDAYISRDLFESYKSKYPYPKKGQVLLSAAGTIGKSIIFDGEDAYFQDSNIVWIDSNENIINNTFLHYCFKYLVDWGKYKTDGSIISRLYNDDLKAISLILPPLSVQTEVSEKIQSLEIKISELEDEMANCDRRKIQVVNRYISYLS